MRLNVSREFDVGLKTFLIVPYLPPPTPFTNKIMKTKKPTTERKFAKLFVVMNFFPFSHFKKEACVVSRFHERWNWLS